MTDDSSEPCDIVISGGGMVGAAMACALGHEELLKQKRILLLEAGPKKEFRLRETYNNRTCTLSPASTQLFQRIGAWEEVLNLRCQPVHKMQIWESCSNSLITFNQEDLTEQMAYVAENDVILEAITRRLETLSDRVEVLYNTRVQHIDIPSLNSSQPNTWVRLKLQDGKSLKTKLLIGSDGMRSSVREAAKFHTVSLKYDQTAVVAALNISEMENTTAWQRFLPTGPIALLPLSNSVCSLIWTTSTAEAKYLVSLSEDSFIDAVNDAFWHEREINPIAVKLGDLLQNVIKNIEPSGNSVRQLPPTIIGVQPDTRACFPLGLTHSSNYVKHRIALIGDAAHRMHPLAGQGVNQGFGDVAKLTEVLTKAVYDGSDLGSVSYLKEYETARQRKVVPVMATVDGLQRLYSTDFTPIVLLRSMGLQATNAMSFLKEKIVKEASI